MSSCPLDSSRSPRPRAPSPFVTSVPLTLFVDRLFREFTRSFFVTVALCSLSCRRRHAIHAHFNLGVHPRGCLQVATISCSFSPFSILMTVSVRCRVRICYLSFCACVGDFACTYDLSLNLLCLAHFCACWHLLFVPAGSVEVGVRARVFNLG